MSSARELHDLGTYAARMAASDHRDDCPSLGPPKRPLFRLVALEVAVLDGFTDPPPRCDGCISAEERELWAQLADEIEHYLEVGTIETEPLF